MLVAASFPSFDAPKIISGIRKRDIISPTPNIRPKLSGELLVKCGHEKSWWPRKVTVRGGQLVVSSRRSDDSLPTLSLPLRQLNLQAGPLVNSLALTKGSVIVLTIQTSNEQNFDLWVKAIAIELIRQTPIFAVKYLDILNLTGSCKKKEDDQRIDHNMNRYDAVSKNISEGYKENQCSNGPRQEKFCSLSPSSTQDTDSVPDGRLLEEKTVETILKKCQNVENYVPVREKLVLFESLCRLGRKVRSTEDVSYKSEVETKRARSMHDLSNFSSHIAVREICKYFEKKTDTKENAAFMERNRRLLSSVSQLHTVQTLRKALSR